MKVSLNAGWPPGDHVEGLSRLAIAPYPDVGPQNFPGRATTPGSTESEMRSLAEMAPCAFLSWTVCPSCKPRSAASASAMSRVGAPCDLRWRGWFAKLEFKKK